MENNETLKLSDFDSNFKVKEIILTKHQRSSIFEINNDVTLPKINTIHHENIQSELNNLNKVLKEKILGLNNLKTKSFMVEKVALSKQRQMYIDQKPDYETFLSQCNNLHAKALYFLELQSDLALRKEYLSDTINFCLDDKKNDIIQKNLLE